MKKILSAVTLLLLVTLLAGCGEFPGFDRFSEDFHYSYDLKPGSHVRLENGNGKVDIVGWDRDTLDVSGTKYASSKELLGDIRIKVQVSGDSAVIRTDMSEGGRFRGSRGASYTVRVPRRTDLERIQTTNGSVSVEDIEGGANLSTTNGRIRATRLLGPLTLGTTNGGIDLEGVSGLVRAHTTNGGIHGELKSGALRGETTNGSIEISIRKPAANEPVRLHTTNGRIELSVPELNGNDLEVGTTHGSITLRLPDPLNAQLKAGTTVASIENEFALNNVSEQSKHRIEGRIGSGGPSISVSTTTGKIEILKY